MIFIEVDYDKMIIILFFNGIQHDFDLKQGDAGEFWYGFNHKKEDWDLNFFVNDDGYVGASLYSTTEDEEGFISIDSEEFTLDYNKIKETGDREKYLSYWWYEKLRDETHLKNLNQDEVWKILQTVGKLHHYLAHKDLKDWDEYDLSNYKSILNKY